MTDMISTPQFEDEIRLSFGVPEIRAEFVDQLYGDLMQHAAAKPKSSRKYLGLRPAWAIALVLFVLVIIGTLAIGPDRVYAAIRQFFGYIPGVGIVDQSSPIRILAEQVSISRDGITVSVNHAVLTGTETRIDFGVSGVPLSAYPKGEVVSGCIEQEYLRLPDGSRMDLNAPIPAKVNEAVFVLPCIFNTLPGAVPIDWELAIHFVAAPPDLTILPIVDVTPQVTVVSTINRSHQTTDSPTITITNAPPQASVSVDKFIETENGYILLGSVRPHIPQGSWLQLTGNAIIRDAGGKKVSYSFPNDVQPLDDSGLGQGGFSWVMQIKGAGVKFPLAISFSGVIISQVDPQASAKITMDVGPNPQPEQVWEVNQDVQLAGNSMRLVSLTAQSDGYSFLIDPGENLSGVGVQIEGHPANGGGGGNFPTNGKTFTTSLIYNDLPKGELTILFSNPSSASPTETWQGQWQPEITRDFAPIAGDANICWDADSFQTMPLLPAGLNGKVLVTQLNPQIQILMAGMDGSQQQVIATGSGRAALTQDGTRLAYATDEGIVIQDLTSGRSTVLTGIFGRELHWSQDGSQIAFVINSVDINGVFVTDSDGKNSKQLSILGYESIAGWSLDGLKLYYAIPGSSGDGFQLRSVELSTGNTQDLFVLEDSSRKAPMPAVSPDGKWVAYRASDSASLYIKGMDGSQARLILDNPATAINGIAWEKESHLLGVSLITSEYPDGEIILMAPDSCETYRLPGLSGQLDGVLIP